MTMAIRPLKDDVTTLTSLNIQDLPASATARLPKGTNAGAGALFFGGMTTAQRDLFFTVANGKLLPGATIYNFDSGSLNVCRSDLTWAVIGGTISPANGAIAPAWNVGPRIQIPVYSGPAVLDNPPDSTDGSNIRLVGQMYFYSAPGTDDDGLFIITCEDDSTPNIVQWTPIASV